MSVARLLIVAVLLISLLLPAAARAQGSTIQARTPEKVYSVELPGEKGTQIVCTGDSRSSTADCVEEAGTICSITEVSFRERIGVPAKSCKVSGCSPKAGMAAASNKCACTIRVSDCR